MNWMATLAAPLLALVPHVSTSTTWAEMEEENRLGFCHSSQVGEWGISEVFMADLPEEGARARGKFDPEEELGRGATRASSWKPAVDLKQHFVLQVEDTTWGIAGDLRIFDVTRVVEQARASLAELAEEVPDWETEVRGGATRRTLPGASLWTGAWTRGITLMGRALHFTWNVKIVEIHLLSRSDEEPSCLS